MTAPAPIPPEVEALALATLAKRVKERDQVVRALFSQHYPRGRRETFRSPLDGARLGAVQVTDPDPDWRIVDQAALEEHLAAEFPGTVETVYDLAVPGVGMVSLSALDELAQVLLAHAPHMLAESRRVSPDAVAAALDQSRATGVAAGPGITLVRPGGQLRVVPDKDAAVAIERMVAAGLLTWDGRPSLPTPASDASEETR